MPSAHATLTKDREPETLAQPAPGARQPVIWFEIEDVLRHFDHFPNPTGISRVCLEILSEVHRLYAASGRVRFCRLSLYRNRFEPVDIERLMAAYLDPPGADAPWHALTWLDGAREELARIPWMVVRFPRYLGRVARPLTGDMTATASHWRRFDDLVQPGDIMVSLGASWINQRYAEKMTELKRTHGVKFVQLIHDIIFAVHPEWVDVFAQRCLPWLKSIVAPADLLLTVSSFSRDDLQGFAAARGIVLPPVETVSLGTSFHKRRVEPRGNKQVAFPNRFALFVSTIDRRKNHPFLLRVWRKLIERHGADAVPHLVLVGRPGWMVVDFKDVRAELAATKCLNGKVMLLSNLSDTELHKAYARCAFTLYPSLYEGWGLPVAESLAHGKFCIVSNRTSLPEVGGAFVDYFDPESEPDALAKIERVLFEPGYLSAREANLRARYRPSTWTGCVQGMMEQLDGLTSQDTIAAE